MVKKKGEREREDFVSGVSTIMTALHRVILIIIAIIISARI